MTKIQRRLLWMSLVFAAAMALALPGQPATTDPVANQIGRLIRERLDAYGRADAVEWARYVAPDCLCGTSSRADLQREIAARNAGTRIWYGDIDALQVQQHGDTVVARYRSTEHTEIAGQRLSTEMWRTETFRRQGTGWVLIAVSDSLIPADPPIAKVDPGVLDTFAGRYAYDANLVDTVNREGDHLVVQATGQTKEEIFPENETTYFAKGQDWRVLFDRDAQGRVIGLRFRQHGQDIGARRLDAAGSAVQARDGADRAKLIGTWRLVTYEDRPDQGPLRLPYGASPQGLLIYDGTGHMSIQIMKVPHPKVASGDDEKITQEEKAVLFDAYTAYFGTYSVDAARGVVIHHVQGDFADVFIGRAEERPYELTGDRLVLTPQWETDGKHWRGTRVFERVK